MQINSEVQEAWRDVRDLSDWPLPKSESWFFASLTGSRAFGTHHGGSDVDLMVVGMPKYRQILRGKVHGTKRYANGGVDAVYHSLHKFMSLLRKSNPMSLVAICCPELVVSGRKLWKYLHRHRRDFLSTRLSRAALGMSANVTSRKQGRISLRCLQIALSALTTYDISMDTIRRDNWWDDEWGTEEVLRRVEQKRVKVERLTDESTLSPRVHREVAMVHTERLTECYLHEQKVS